MASECEKLKNIENLKKSRKYENIIFSESEISTSFIFASRKICRAHFLFEIILNIISVIFFLHPLHTFYLYHASVI